MGTITATIRTAAPVGLQWMLCRTEQSWGWGSLPTTCVFNQSQTGLLQTFGERISTWKLSLLSSLCCPIFIENKSVLASTGEGAPARCSADFCRWKCRAHLAEVPTLS